jgi:hypothetical protein
MLVGHVAAGMVGKRAAPRVSLGTLVLAAVLCDLLWGAFLLAGLEHIIIRPGRGAANYLDAVDTSLSHGLATTVLSAVLFAGVWFLRRRDTRAAFVLFALVLSHWLLDFISHGRDMALAPGVHTRVGLGLWNSIPATIAIEGGFWLIAVILYSRATQPRTRWTAFVFWIFIGLLTLVWYNNIAGPPPANARAAAMGSLILFSAIVAWAYWMNAARETR